jgi:outer membrane lipoprotein-sorting protein
MQGKVWMWKQIPMKMEMSIVGKTVTSTLKHLEEDPGLAANIFDVPADIEFREMNLPATAAK